MIFIILAKGFWKSCNYGGQISQFLVKHTTLIKIFLAKLFFLKIENAQKSTFINNRNSGPKFALIPFLESNILPPKLPPNCYVLLKKRNN